MLVGEAIDVTRPVPYPAETRAKGWRFELDHERIEQSDTWALAPADVRPWLLLLWLTAWRQEPCGSLPNDDELIAAKIGMPLKVFSKVRAKLMRNWWLAEDGRLYHDTVTLRVTEMLTARDGERRRKAEYRQRKDAERAAASAGSPDLSHGTDGGQRQDSTRIDAGRDGTGTGTGTGLDTPPIGGVARKRAPPSLARPEDVEPQTWSDWSALRKRHKADASATAVEAARREADKAGMTLEAFLRVWCLRGSRGLHADWLRPDERVRGVPAETPYQRAQRERVAQFAPGVAAKPPGQQAEVIDLELLNVPAIARG